jgi:hypothetical protein
MTVHPAALQLRLLQTVVEVAAEKNSTLVLPFPVELLRFLERATPEASPAAAPTTTGTSGSVAAHPQARANGDASQSRGESRTERLSLPSQASAVCATVAVRGR